MRITIHNNNLEVVDHLDNSIPGSLKFYNDTLEMYLKGDAATFDFTVDKFVNEKLQDRLQHLKANMFVSFVFEDMDFLMSVRNMTQNDYSMTFQCENASMELLNEYPKEFKQDEKNPMSYTLEEYLDLCQAFTRAKIRININQLTNVKKVLSISSSTNIYGTILNLVEAFGGECQIIPTMFEDGRGLKDIRINIFKAKTNTDLYSGIGTNREDVMLYMDRQVKGVSYTHDRTKQYTAVKIKDKDGKYYRARKNYIVKHPDGKHNEFYMMRNSTTMYAPLAMLEYPSMIHANECDNWTVQEIKTDLDPSDHEGLYQAGLKALMEHAYGVKKYTIQLDGEKIRKKYRLTVGDVIYISDNNFLNGLLLRVRIEKISTSLSKPMTYKIEVSNVVEMASQLSSSMLDRYARMIEDAKPYTMSVLTSNGVAFKSLDDETRLYPRLYKGGKLQREDTGRYFTYEVNDQVIGSGDYLDIKSKDYAGQEKIVVKVKGWDNGEVVFQNDLTIFTVKDGKDAYSLIPSTSNGTQFVNGYGISAVSLKLLKGAEQLNLDDYAISWKMKHGNETGFSDFSSINKQISVSTTDFVKTATYYATVTTKKGALIATTEVTFSNVQDGAAGTPGAVGRDGRQSFVHFAYANSGDGRKDFHVSDGTNKEYLGQYTDFVQADSNDPTRYTWIKIKGEKGDKGERGEQGPKGVDGRNGNDGLPGRDGKPGKDGVGIRQTTILYGISDSDKTEPATWTEQPPTLVKEKWFWTKTSWSYTDNTVETSVQKVYIPRNGNDGLNGIPGKDGVGIRSTVVDYAVSNDGVNRPTGGWSRQVPTEKLNFTWMRMTLTYTDNTSESVYTVSKNGQDGRPGRDGINGLQGPKGDQGLPGRDGANGVSSYTHIAYADNQNGDGFSQTDINKLYIGMYVDNIQQDSNDKTKYRWTKWRGQDGQAGVPGRPGADGRTPYVHFAYANSADGRSDFSLVNTNNKFRYIGHYTDFEPADSRDPGRYSWIDMTGGVVIGGDNLVRNSAFPKSKKSWGYWEYEQDNNNLQISNHPSYYNNTMEVFKLNNNGNGEIPAATQRFPIKRNTTYSLNVSMCATNNIKKVYIYFLGRKIGESASYTKVVNVKSIEGSPSTTQLVRFENTFNSGECDEGFIRIYNGGHTGNDASSLFFTELDIYEGSTPRVWQASPYDLADNIETKADNALTTQQLQLLAESDAKIRAEMQAKAAADEVQRWITDYKTYLKSSQADRIKIENDLVTQAQRIVQLQTSLGDMAAKTSFIDSFITESNEGLTIGKIDGSSSIMFSPAGRISMFSSGKEVMYIDKGMLYIDNGTFVKTIQVGRYRTEQYFADLDMNVVRYVGDINNGGN
nr:MAG TPA: tail protein [Caudoviricetes sp.]